MNSKKVEEISESLEAMHKFAQIYAKQTNTFFCFDPSITSVVITGLANYKNKYGVPLCPCRNYHNEKAEIDLNYWICPCVSMRERKECHCTLFLKPDQEYASQTQKIDIDTIYENL
uniref:Ferredoxin thioredoxin reductase, beta subunit n=1 Tax=Microzonia abyssicola TaxID=217214 RepID=UPI002E78CD96|nr:Ferredoxin thioredoxin reductase, beta subunit [Syringoderma abyssicola]WAM65058.1 Ferredoxin thioredoxin reductase, beta subunit [Syringoderma abyssicola]